MKALSYLTGTKLKNQIKNLFQKPARLIYVVFILACLAITLIGGRAADQEPGRTFRSMEELCALASAVYLLIFAITVNTGFSRGGNLFNMSDVNLLFPAPIRPQTILFHGLLQQMATSLLIGIFLLFQYATLHGAYGISYGQLLLLLLGYALSVFFGQVVAMVIYSFTNGNETRQRLCRGVFYGVLIAFVVYVLVTSGLGGKEQMLPRAVTVMNSPVFRCLPVAGWLGLAISGLLVGNALWALLGFLLCAVFLGLMIFVIFRLDADYYEDVIKSAEIAQSAITAKKEGTMVEAAPQNVKVGKIGLGGGWGASAFFYKHMLENRRSRRFILSTYALIFAVATIVFSFFVREGGIFPVFLFATYMQVFSVMVGRFNLELLRPYLYLVPEPPMKKLLWALAESFPSALLEAVVVFVPVGFILSLSVPDVLLCILARISYAMLFLAADIVVERLWGGTSSKFLVLFLFFMVVIGLALPGVVIMSVLVMNFGASTPVALGVLTLCNVPMSLLALFLCRNMLQYAELNNQ